MKAIVSSGLLIALSLLVSSGNAQVCINGISTNPIAPNNSDLNYPTTNNLWLNSFDFGANNGFAFSDIQLNPNGGWAIPDFTSPAQFTMFNPFTSAGAPGTPHLSAAIPFQNRDFHWEDGWELQPLSEVEAYVLKHKHLPGIAPASKIELSGIPLGEMERLLTIKVEELTLHLIEMNKEMQALRTELEALKAIK